MAAPQTQSKTLSPAMSSLLPSDNSHSPCSTQSLLRPSSFDTATTTGDAATFVTRISSSASTTPLDISPSPSVTSFITTNTNTSTTSSSACSNSSKTPIESLRRYPLDLTGPIPEEHDEETGSESFSNEPATPISGRQSRDFRYCEQNDTYLRRDSITNGLAASSSGVREHPDVSLTVVNKDVAANPALLLPPSTVPVPPSQYNVTPLSPTPFTTQSEYDQPNFDRRPSTTTTITTAPVRNFVRRSSSALTRMASIFKRNSFHVGDGSVTTEFRETNYNGETSESTLASTNRVTPNDSRRRFSYHRSAASTRSNTPPSPASPLDTPPNSQEKSNGVSIPTSRDFLENNSKKARANTGLSLRNRVVGFASTKAHSHRRTRSLERKKRNEEELTRQPWAIPPDAGTGMKARRLSLSLPDDFTVDVADLTKEFEYQHKFLGRHGKHLGKGATSKVTLMVRKGNPGELYAVKEFRSKSSSETVGEYEKKIKSEYSIAKSLHHPNIVETIRLCTDHGRWNHVMEYCSEGDLFGLVSKKYLRDESREVDRMCLFKQLCQGINYLHSNGIAHRDIKLENLLITKDSKLKITDFGVSEVFSGIHPGLREAGGQCGVGMGEIRLCKPGICGSLPYIAPEVLTKDVDYDPRALDVWSSAIVMLYLIFNANLWEKAQAGLTSPSQRTYNELVNGWTKINAKREANPDQVGEDTYPKVTAFEIFVRPAPLRRLLLKMLNPDPKKRITMSEVMSNRWMKNVECCQLESYEDPTKYIDASKKDWMKSGTNKIFCHNHLPPMSTGHGLPPMPGKPGY
ncbi:kinase-like domain-containing protein [Daldinia caldariorum]|uniref:kinase-like domain-containing protein n=1 Tax=Daldinia caldariorum TaxID=326644 RepID=UPI002008BF04|nr:kinase-like domain-containing protein [Daldinia caldariorum]KAI1472332.1 kinase-like domain-containing protein [Daldinia caldariorum]